MIDPDEKTDLVHKENQQLHDLLNQLADRILAPEINVEKHREHLTIRWSANRCGRRRKAVISSNLEVAAVGAILDVPLGHKDDS